MRPDRSGDIEKPALCRQMHGSVSMVGAITTSRLLFGSEFKASSRLSSPSADTATTRCGWQSGELCLSTGLSN